MTGERLAGDMKEERVITVWPCDHGDVLVESGRCAPNYQCAECGAKPRFYVPEPRALQAEERRDAALRAVFEAAPVNWAQIAVEKAGFSNEDVRRALSHHQPEEKT